MKVLVTGGAGFIGSNLVRYLLFNTDLSVVVVDSLTYAGNMESLKDCLVRDRMKFVRADITNMNEMSSLFESEKFNAVFHLAAESHVDRSISDAAPFIQTNVTGTFNVLHQAFLHNVEKFIHVSTDEVYGSLNPTQPPFTESNPIAPSSPYAASKAASDFLVYSYWKTHGFNAVITRCSNNYGPFQFPEKLIPLMVLNAFEQRTLPIYGDGQQVRDWIHVEDHCKGLMAAYLFGEAGEVYNLGGECELTNKAVVGRILAITGASADLVELVEDRKGHDRRYAMNIEKAKSRLNWQPTTGFANGLETTIEWYRNNAKWSAAIRNGSYRDYYKKHYKTEF